MLPSLRIRNARYVLRKELQSNSINYTIMKINEEYSLNEIKSNGLIERNVKDIEAKVFTADNKVYLFENVGNKIYRLYTVINKRSFFL